MSSKMRRFRRSCTLAAVCIGTSLIGDAAQPGTPPLLLLDSQHLSASRARAREGDVRLKLALQALEQDAAKALSLKPLSVMDKGVSPPSGDKQDYSVFNLTAFFHLAALGDRAGVVLWEYRGPGGRSLRQGLDFLVPFASGSQRWTLPQITEFRGSAMHWLLRRAAVAWKEPKYAALAAQVGGGSPRMDLTLK